MKKISKNCYISEEHKVKSVLELYSLAQKKEAVYHPNFKIKPAMVLIQMSCTVICKAILNGNIYKIIK